MTPASSKPLANRRVLLVEDQYLVAEELRRMVQSLGGEVVGPVPRAQPALELLEYERLDLALLDINLGPDDVYPLAAELIRRHAPFIFVTGAEPWVIPEAFRGVPRLDKPVTSKLLAETLKRLGL